ncbi:hypothetical protein [Herbiconiux sp. L3-i23]|uniref:hypothetical protein n=1 Tax=Herbiconiux sp. L3-i23 TaxID=2905871 RepID=UPI002049CFD0|nr:hypothetical protein [Herbiconiux sp. L3-i23]BDI21626.1 hypothetical protein L3i23_04020 [Herbiconiux sp. L3-i23]
MITRWSRSRSFAASAVVVALGVVIGLLTAVAPQNAPAASAANASDFQPGYLISDYNFFDSGSMTAGEIQNFLNSKISGCRGSNGMPCLKDYVAQSTPSLSANSYCRAFPGGTMSAASLIAAVSQACGISPKVILVMLQKEQGLVTDTAPTPRSYSAALGQGCPDGAACDPSFAGFFYQVYGAARQFQIYMQNPRSFSYQLGWNNILYQATPPDTNRVCGTRSVYIQNDATRALYVYTPYTPNQAALNNLYGTGDFCSAYGNRNFWRLYTDWFGDPTGSPVVGEYAKVWAAIGGASGLLGGPTGIEECNGRYCLQTFRGGTIFWFPGRGVFAVPSVVEGIWRNLGFVDGAAGAPTGVVVCESDGTCTQSFDGGVIAADGNGGSLVGRHLESAWLGNGAIRLGGARGPEVCADGRCAQLFARGALFSGGPATAVTGAIFSAWNSAGLTSGQLGYPIANAVCSSSGCTQTFGGGLIASAGGRAEVVPEPIATKYLALGGPARLGGPAGPAACDSAGACSQTFGGGRIDVTAQGAAVTERWFLEAWATAGYEQGRLGRPLADMTCSPATCYQSFAGGILSGSPSGNVVAVFGAYRDSWLAAGGPSGSLGLPLSGESCNGRDCSQPFQGGVVVWTPANGAVIVSSWFVSPWQSQGSGLGRLGAPVSGMVCEPATCYQSFEGGILSGSPSGAILPVFGAYRDSWLAAGGPSGSLGLPLSGESCNGRDCSQPFQGGVVVWTPANGAVIVSSWFVSPWQSQGSGLGRLGAPVSGMVCEPATCYQSFEGGILSGSPSGAILPVFGAYRDSWLAAGGPSGSLGLPTRAEACRVTWCDTEFQRGVITWTPSMGALPVAQPVFGRWSQAGGVDGQYGLPVAPAVASGNAVTQQFQRGTVSVSG